MRPERNLPDLAYKLFVKEPLLVVLSGNHRLARRKAVTIEHIVNETFIGMSKTAPSLQGVIDAYLKGQGTRLHAEHEADNLAMAISLAASTGGNNAAARVRPALPTPIGRKPSA